MDRNGFPLLTRRLYVAPADYVREGYGLPAPTVMEAIDLFATMEAIIVDPVYSAKAAAALTLAAKREGPVVFWHTSAYHSLFGSHFASTWLQIERLAAVKL